MPRPNRRHFLQSTLAAAATVTIAGTKSSARVVGANDTVRLAIAGLNGRGGDHIKEFARMKGVEIVALVDPDTRVFKKRLAQLDDPKLEHRHEPKTYQDIRHVLERPDVDAVAIATPNHWHSLMTIWACQAGKDVYVEKPLSHNIFEGRIAVEAARKYNRIVQHGSQRRASGSWVKVLDLVKSGRFGKLLVSRGLCYKPRPSIGVKPASDVPPEVDYSLWLGPARERPFHANLVHYNWHWFWDFGNGDIGNQGVHQVDVARWLIPGATWPDRVVSLGGRYGYKDQGETPNTQLAVFDYGETVLIFEVRGLATDRYLGEAIGNLLHFEEGVLACADGQLAKAKFYPKGGDAGEPVAGLTAQSKDGKNSELPGARPGGGSIFANFIACVRSRKQHDLYADVLEGHYSSALCHMANISYRLGQDVPFRSLPSALENHAVREALDRTEAHLEKAGQVRLDSDKVRLGRVLTIDPSTEGFLGDAQANALRTRDYRTGFVVPESV